MDRLDVAAALLRELGVRHLPVCESGRLLGMVSVRDLLQAAPPHGALSPRQAALALRGLEARRVMSSPPIVALADEPVGHAARRMMARRISALPVLAQEGGALVGILTDVDLLSLAARRLAAECDGPRLVRWLMTPRPLATIGPDETLDLALSLMHADRIRHLPVVDAEERLVGILSDRDALAADSPLAEESPEAEAARLLARGARRVREVMTGEPLTIAPGASAVEAARLLGHDKFGALPVVDEGRLVGIVTVSDFLFYLRNGDEVSPPPLVAP
jgi:CBS domain-containing protein